MSEQLTREALRDIVGAPYVFPPDPPRTFDCWTLLVYVRQLLGLETKVEIDPSLYDLTNMDEAVAEERCNGRWQPVSGRPRDGDAVLFAKDHIGVVMGTVVLHAHAPSRSVLATKLEVVKRRWPLMEVWRP